MLLVHQFREELEQALVNQYWALTDADGVVVLPVVYYYQSTHPTRCLPQRYVQDDASVC